MKKNMVLEGSFIMKIIESDMLAVQLHSFVRIETKCTKLATIFW
jgi:hypothetical protein